LQGFLAALGAGAGDDYLAYAGVKCRLYNLVAVGIKRVVREVTANVYEFHGAHCNGFFLTDAYTCFALPYNPADASEMERLVAPDAVRPAYWHLIAIVADAMGLVDCR
jgi:hypothetical protein